MRTSNTPVPCILKSGHKKALSLVRHCYCTLIELSTFKLTLFLFFLLVIQETEIVLIGLNNDVIKFSKENKLAVLLDPVFLSQNLSIFCIGEFFPYSQRA